MKRAQANNRGVALLLVFTTLIIVVILTNVGLRLILNQQRLTHHQVSRIRAYYASLAGMNLALEKLRLGQWAPPARGVNYGCINGCIDGRRTYPLINDGDIPYNVQIAIYPAGTGLNGVGSRLEIRTRYTYS